MTEIIYLKIYTDVTFPLLDELKESDTVSKRSYTERTSNQETCHKIPSKIIDLSLIQSFFIFHFSFFIKKKPPSTKR
jgi:hypothetical protein